MHLFIIISLMVTQALEIQTDWVSGPGVLGPVNHWGSAFYQSDSINYNISGQISLIATSLGDSWVRHNIEENGQIQAHTSIFPADFDGDGDYDLAGWLDDSNIVRIYRNKLVETDTMQFVIEKKLTGADGSDFCIMWIGDLDRDGDPDIVVPGAGLWWFKNNGSFNFTIYQISTQSYSYPCCNAADIDNDNDIDIVVGAIPFDIYRNNGAMSFTREYITDAYWYWRINLGYLNNDNYIDFLSIGNVHINTGGSFNATPDWSSNTWVDGSWIRDFNNDGKNDILLCERYDYGTRWHQNTGTGVNYIPHLVTTSPDYEDCCIAEDINLDGKADVIGTYYKVGFFKQITLDSFQEIIVDPDFWESHWAWAKNLDYKPGGTDFDIDILASAEDKFAWWENFGTGVRFASYGNLTSSILRNLNALAWKKLNWNGSRPTGTIFKFFVRSGADSASIGSNPWQGPFTVPTGQPSGYFDISGVTTPGHHYFQYKLEMGGDTLSPVLYELAVECSTAINRDVGMIQIIGPSGIVDSGSVVIPQARVKNFGIDTASFPVTFRVGTYTRTKSIDTLHASRDTLINFPPCTLRVRGWNITKCSTSLVGDQNPANDTLTGSVRVRVTDVGANSIYAPTGTIDSSSVPIIPRARVNNYGTDTVAFPVIFKIGTFYTDTVIDTLTPNSWDTVYFDNWTPLQRGGPHTTKCSTALAGDQRPSNNRVTGTVSVRVIDVGATRINVPSDTVDTNFVVIPKATIKNYGTVTIGSFPVIFKIGTFYNDTVYVYNLSAGDSIIKEFDPWLTLQAGTHTMKCSTAYRDSNPTNNLRTGSVTVYVWNTNVGVIKIIEPVGYVDSGKVLIPQAKIRNFGRTSASFPVTFTIGSLYTSNKTVTNLNPRDSIIVNFDTWTALPVGKHITKCTTQLTGDQNPRNNVLKDSIVVRRPVIDSLKWRYLTGGYITSSPAVGSDSTIYVGSNDSCLYAIKPNGILKWRYKTGNQIYYSSPAIGSDGSIYIGSNDNYIYAVNQDGSLKWRYLTGDDVRSSPAIGFGDIIYVGSNDNYLYAINHSGTLKWRYLTGNDVISSPAIGFDTTIYVGSNDGHLYAVNPNGTLKWRNRLSSNSITCSPAIGLDGTVYVAANDGNLYSIYPDSTIKWKKRIGFSGTSYYSSPALGAGDTIYIGSVSDSLYAIKPDSTLKWRYRTRGDILSSPAIGSDSTIFVGSNDDSLHAININGTLKWRYRTGGDVQSSPSIGPGGIIYVGSNDGYLYAIYGSGTLANTHWPKFHHDLKNTGRVSGVSNEILVWISDTTGAPNDTIWVPIMVTDATNKGIVSCDITLRFDSHILSADSVSLGTVAPLGWLIQGNYFTDSIRIGMAGGSPLSGAGSLAWIRFIVDANATPNETTTIHFAKCSFNEGTIPNQTQDGLFTVLQLFSISGFTKYYKTPYRAIPNTEMILSGYRVDTTLTDTGGYYILNSLPGFRNYIVKPRKINYFQSQAITSFDAALVLRHVINVDTLDSLELIAADVSGNGSVSSYDAALILRYTVGVIYHFPAGYRTGEDTVDWAFRPPTRNYSSLDSNRTNQNYVSILYGEVSGNWTPSDSGVTFEPMMCGGNLPTEEENITINSNRLQQIKKSKIQEQKEANPKVCPTYSIGQEKSTSVGQSASSGFNLAEKEYNVFPIKVSNAKNVVSADIILTYDTDEIEIKDVMLGHSTFNYLIAWAVKNGVVRIALAGINPLIGIIELSKVCYQRKSQNVLEQTMQIQLKSIVLNEGQDSIILTISNDGVENNKIALSTQFYFASPMPNPFGKVTYISYGLPKESYVKLEVFDAAGRNIRTLIEASQPAGRYSIIWDGKDEQCKQSSNGIYFIWMKADTHKFLRKVIMLKQ